MITKRELLIIGKSVGDKTGTFIFVIKLGNRTDKPPLTRLYFEVFETFPSSGEKKNINYQSHWWLIYLSWLTHPVSE